MSEIFAFSNILENELRMVAMNLRNCLGVFLLILVDDTKTIVLNTLSSEVLSKPTLSMKRLIYSTQRSSSQWCLPRENSELSNSLIKLLLMALKMRLLIASFFMRTCLR